jgi:hypothetical protein
MQAINRHKQTLNGFFLNKQSDHLDIFDRFYIKEYA